MDDTEQEPALIRRVVDRDDRAAFGELTRRHQSQVRTLLRKLTCGDHALADDLAQETFVRAYQRLSTFEGTAKLSTWLYRIAVHVSLDARAREKAGRAREEKTANDHHQAAEFSADQAMLRHDIERALACLDDRERAAVALTFGQDLTHEDAARVLHCPLGSLKTTVARALTKLEAHMRPYRSTG